MQSGRQISARLLEPLLYLTAALLIAGHIVNRLTSPRPLNPLWNRISTFAASHYGGHYVTAGIAFFALCIPLFGLVVWLQTPATLTSRAASICAFFSAIPMLMVAIYPIFTPYEEIAPRLLSARTLAAVSSNHIHNVSSAIAFALLLSAILLWSIAFLRQPHLKRLGQSGLLLVPVIIIFLVKTYHGTTYNGSWQRGAFLLQFLWLFAGSRRFRSQPA